VYDGLFDAVGVPGGNPPVPRGDAPPARSSDVQPVADVPVASLGDGPVYDRPATAPPQRAALHADDPASVLAPRFPSGTDLSEELLAVLASPNIADKSWVYRQYDHQLFLNTVVAPGGDASVRRLKGTSRALALTTDGEARFCALDPYTGARLTVIEAARNLACVGAVPKALVNCLNFGNPEHPEVMRQFAEVVDGMSARAGRSPYRSSAATSASTTSRAGRDIDPTPVIGVVGSSRS
jgi:phosphoribosylformylglycinamidine synthase